MTQQSFVGLDADDAAFTQEPARSGQPLQGFQEGIAAMTGSIDARAKRNQTDRRRLPGVLDPD